MTLPELTDAEVRVLGVLIEKSLQTPDLYPLSLNALLAGCNQRNNREPVVTFTEDVVEATIEALRRKQLLSVQTGAGSRVVKYRHFVGGTYDLTMRQLGLMAELLLRGPQTVGELRQRTSRMVAFSSLEEVQAEMSPMLQRDVPLVAELPPQPGKREVRYAHRFQPVEERVSASAPVVNVSTPLDGIVEELEALRARVAYLEEELAAFKAQFG